ncbi:hypothetical protein ACIP9C_08480 [Lysinibacillus sp. NPDC093210]|uniref:hypothetical protein n=1 Tax=Lysinibacillus sp. NPDC093210 TaxID=3364133 RepID=UPI0037F539A5
MKKIITQFLVVSTLFVTFISGPTTKPATMVDSPKNIEVVNIIEVLDIPDLPSQH